jgi:uncharacterized protein (TIGR03435 family)
MVRRFLFTVIAFTAVSFGQSFEAAAIKPNTSGSFNSHGHSDNLLINLENYSLKQLILDAYSLKDYALTGPSWLDDVRFDVVAKVPDKAPSQQIPIMMHSMLAERFGLKVHREPKMISGYALMAGKKPPVLHESQGGGSNTNSNNGKLTGTNVSMEKLADILSRQIRQPVQNQTGLTGVLDVNLAWTPDQADPTVDGPGSIFTALQEQLGLKLEAKKITIDAVVVDHVERVPTEN